MFIASRYEANEGDIFDIKGPEDNFMELISTYKEYQLSGSDI